MLTTSAAYRSVVRDLDRSLGVVARRPEIRREAAYYLAHIREAKSVDAFLKDDRLYTFAMSAYGLKDMLYAKAFMRKVLSEGVDGAKSFAVQLADPRFREFAEAFNFARYGATATVFDRAQQGAVDRYVRIALETDAGRQDEGVRLALYFQRKAPSVTTAYGLLADAAVYKVVQTALQIPPAASASDIDKHAAFIAAKINVEDFKDPDKLSRFISRFTALWQAGNANAQGQAPQIGLVQPLLTTISNSAMLLLQSLRIGGR